MKKKVLVIIVCLMLVTTSTVILIKPENLEVKAIDGGGVGGNGDGINTSYIHTIAQELSNIVITFPKGRAFGTPGEHYAAVRIKEWMNEIGLSNIHYENITGTATHPKLNTTEDILSEGIYFDDQKLTECYISPLLNYTNDALAHNYSYENLEVRRPPLFPHVKYLFDNPSFIRDLFTREDNGSIYDFSTFFDFCLERFEEKYNFNIDTFNISDPDTYPSWCNGALPDCTGWSPFVFIVMDDNFNTYLPPPPLSKLSPLGLTSLFFYKFVTLMQMWWWNSTYLNQNFGGLFKGLIKFDYNLPPHDTYNMMLMNNIVVKASVRPNQPVLFITGNDGGWLYLSVPDGQPSNTKVSFWVNEKYNETVISSNVIGQISGIDPSRTVIVSCLYDCWWNQGTGDSAIGMGTVLAIAKYMKAHSIKPKYTVKFVAFAGEEQEGAPGAQYYNDTHTTETSNLTIIDLNQLGFNQTGSRPQTFFVDTNKMLHFPTLMAIINDTNYCERSRTPYLRFVYSIGGGPSDCGILIQGKNLSTHLRESILFVKDMNWTMHHRDGENHTKGDTMYYYDLVDVSATAYMIWNVTKYFTVNPNCSFDGTITYTTKDSPNDQDNDNDTIEANMPIKSILPQDHIRVKAKLIQKGHILPTTTTMQDYIITDTTELYTINITLPPGSNTGKYKMYLELYNSTGRIKDIQLLGGNHPNDTTNSCFIYLYPLGNQPPTTPDGPYGDTTLQVGDLGAWGAPTSDPNNDLVGERWYLWYNNYPSLYKETELYDPQSLSPLMFNRYWNDGTYEIKVKAFDQYSTFLHPYVSDFSDSLMVNVAPHSNIIFPGQQLHQNNLYHAVQGESQIFYGEQSGGQTIQWLWDDGNRNTCTQRNATYTFPNPGTYNISVSVTDDQTDLTGSTYIHVRVTDLDANFNLSYYQGAAANTTIWFYNTSQGINQITNCTWDFGDGTHSYQSNPNHSYYRDGDYNITLTVKDAENNTDVDYYILHINSYPNPPEIPYTQTPGTVLTGSEATILTEVRATDRNITSIKVNITTPDNTSQNNTMTHLVDDIYMYTINNASQSGQYRFTIYAADSENITNSSSRSFTVQPFISLVPPTPEENTIINHSWVFVNISLNDPYITSMFLDWNQSLCGYWPMDLYNDTSIYDTTNRNFGYFQNGLNASHITAGKYGKGLGLDGSDDYVDLGNSSSLNLGTGDFTFMVWEKSQVPSYANTTVILSNQPENANWNGYVFGVKNSAFFYTVQNGQTTAITGIHDVTDNTWHHLAFVRKAGNLSLFVDKVFDTGRTGTLRNITNNKDVCFSYENKADWYHFFGALDEVQLYNRALSRNEINASYNNGHNGFSKNITGLSEGAHLFYANAIDTAGTLMTTEERHIIVDTIVPEITTVSASPNTVGFGFNVTINTNVTDATSGVKNVSVTITYPIGSGNNPVTVPMSHISGTFYRYVFSDTWHVGRYNYTIIAYDNASNVRTSAGHSFNVTVNAMMSVSTLKDSYTGNQYINLTDPPNPPENLTVVGRGLTWNTYYNDSSGCNILESYQGPVNYQENNGSWTPINNTLFALTSDHPAYSYGYRTGNNHGLFSLYFKPDITSDWPVAFTYNKSNDPTINVVRSKLVGVGYLDPASNWSYHYLQNVQSSQGQTNNYAITYPGVFTGTNITWSYGNTGLKEAIMMSNATKTVLENHPPHQYGLHDASSYLVFITKLDYQNLNLYNASGMLSGNVTITDAGVDFKDALGYFKCALPLGDAYSLSNESMRQKLTYRIVHINGDTYLLSGLKVSKLNTMAFPVVVDPTLTVYSISSDGYIYNSNANYNTARTASSGTVNNAGTYIAIGQWKTGIPATYYLYRGFVFFNTSSLPSNAYLDNATLSLYKKDDYSVTDFDITIQNGQPVYPHKPMQSSDYNLNDYAGDGGKLNTAGFTSGYNPITLKNLDWINRTGITKLCLRSSRDINGNTPSGSEYVNVYSSEFLGMCGPKLVVVYRNQSKIKDTGSTNIKGYLLIQVQFYNTSQGKWLIDKDTINETSTRTINSGSQLALDTIFNGHVRASDLTHGAGTYRVYTAFRDPNGNILKTSSGVWLNAWWQFSKT